MAVLAGNDEHLKLGRLSRRGPDDSPQEQAGDSELEKRVSHDSRDFSTMCRRKQTLVSERAMSYRYYDANSDSDRGGLGVADRPRRDARPNCALPDGRRPADPPPVDAPPRPR